MGKIIRRNLLFGILLFLIVSGIFAIKDWPIIKYQMRRINIALFQSGMVEGGKLTSVPAKFHRQEHSLSCEIAALKMALSVYNIDIPESELISKLKFDPTLRTGSTWGDPYTGFVGNIDGKMMKDGYGVYWDPIAEVANNYVEANVTQFTAQKVAAEIDLGHPVIAWGYFGRGKKISWNTPDGKKIDGINGEHARTIIGFTGSIESPTGFIILDPIYGKLYWKTKDLMNNWEPFDHMGIVVYPKSILPDLF
jgi:uncharacterized protein YvpB